jgi:LCP family protein required for cell wall assembly
MESRKRKRKKRTKRKIVLAVMLSMLFLAAGVLFNMYVSVNRTLGEMVNESALEKSEKRPEEISLKNMEGFTVLLLGVDERKGDKGRSDTMIFMSVNGEASSVELVSIPRDTRVTIVGKGKEDKINHAYAFGGVDMSAKTIEEFFDVPVDYYVKVNMEGFKEMVDAVGGITVTNTFAFFYDGADFPKGPITLNGEEALKYSRMRYEDPQGDFGRQARQRQIIQGILNKGASVKSIWSYNAILSTLEKNVETNVTTDEMKTIQKHYASARKNIKQEQIAGTGKKIDGIYYYVVPEEEKARISLIFKNHINIK